MTNRKMRRGNIKKARAQSSASPNDATAAMRVEVVAALSRGDSKGAAAIAEAMIAAQPNSAEAHYFLGNANLFQSRLDDAAASYRRAIEFAPSLVAAHNSLGVVMERLGRVDDAAVCYRKAIFLKPDYADAHNNLGNVLLAAGNSLDALEAYRAAMKARGSYPEACYNLANVLSNIDRPEEAVAAYRIAIAQKPRFPEALNNLSALLVKLGRTAEAVEASEQAVAADPSISESRLNLGDALRDSGRVEEAIASYRHAAALKPDVPKAYISIANILLQRKRTDEAMPLLRHAHKLRPLNKRPGNKPTPDFSVLVLTAPGAANTPSDYLIGHGDYDSYFVSVMTGVDYDIAAMRASGDIIVNLVSDVDMGRDILPLVTELVQKIDRPTINHPRHIAAIGGRETVGGRLAGISRCRVPTTIRVTGTALAAPHTAGTLSGLKFPLLARVAGAHGGNEFEKVDDVDTLAAFVTRTSAVDYYLTEYVPYESADGHFRKYRLIFTNGEIFPYHLAISDQWKVHHFSTNMANQEWMRGEEEAFVKEPSTAFGTAQWEALQKIQAAVGLDYFGIDCGLDHNGDVLVFEVNATMLIHRERSTFAYKDAYVVRIKSAFDAMLAKAAGRAAS